MTYERITNGYINESVVRNLVTNRSTLMELQTQIASGKKMERASEDVFSSITVLNANASLGKIDSYLNNINIARSELEVADKAVLTTVDSVHKARELTIQALNGTSGPDEMNIIAEQVDQLLQNVKAMGNTKYGSKFIFGGQVTNTAPFTEVIAGETTYNGSPDGGHKRNIEISQAVVVPMNLSGDAVFGYYYTGDHDNNGATPDTLEGQGLIQTLTMLKNELALADPDKDAIRTELGNLDGDLQNLLNSQSSIGGLLTRLDITERIQEDDQLSITLAKSNAEDIDYAQVISDLKFQETALQASLQVSSRILQPSLLNYI